MIKVNFKSFFLTLVGTVFFFLSLILFYFSLKLPSNPGLTPEFVEEVFQSVFCFTVAVILLIAGVVFLLYALEFELKPSF